MPQRVALFCPDVFSVMEAVLCHNNKRVRLRGHVLLVSSSFEVEKNTNNNNNNNNNNNMKLGATDLRTDATIEPPCACVHVNPLTLPSLRLSIPAA